MNFRKTFVVILKISHVVQRLIHRHVKEAGDSNLYILETSVSFIWKSMYSK